MRLRMGTGLLIITFVLPENVKENVHVSSAEEKAVESYADWRERILAKAYADREIKNKIKVKIWNIHIFYLFYLTS